MQIKKKKSTLPKIYIVILKNKIKQKLYWQELDEMIKVYTKYNNWNAERANQFIREFLDYMQIKILEPNDVYCKEKL